MYQVFLDDQVLYMPGDEKCAPHRSGVGNG